MCDSYCKVEYLTSCGHLVDPTCLKSANCCCPECKKTLTTLNLFWKILRDSRINESEDFYRRLCVGERILIAAYLKK